MFDLLICEPAGPHPGCLVMNAQTGAGHQFLGSASGLVLDVAVIDALADQAIASGLTVGRPASELPLDATPVSHIDRLRTLRGTLTGADKAAVRWVLNRLAKAEERLDTIRKLTTP